MLKSLKTIVFGLVAASLSMSAMAENERALDLGARRKQMEEGEIAQTHKKKQTTTTTHRNKTTSTKIHSHTHIDIN